MKLKYYIFLVICMFTVISTIGQTADDESEKLLAKQDSVWRTLLGKPFPLDSLRYLEGELLNPNDLVGKPTLINFWFTTCKPCIDEMPVLNEIAKKYSNRVNFVAITFDSSKDVTEFLKRHSFNFKQISDAERYVDRIGFLSFPINVLLDKNGVVSSFHNGIPYISDGKGGLKIGDGKELFEEIEKLLEK